MTEWISANVAVLQLAASLLTALIWVIYLQMLFTSYKRQRRTMILINLGGGVSFEARVFVSNLGFEPVYLLDIFLGLSDNDEDWNAVITDRTELSTEDLTNPRDVTNRGPLNSGETYDIGNVATLVDRAHSQDGRVRQEAIDTVCLTVVAVTAADDHLVAARRAYRVIAETDRTVLRSTTLAAEQIRSRSDRGRLRKRLQSRL